MRIVSARSKKLLFGDGREYVSRAGYKLEGAARAFGVDFRGKVVLDVGSSTGGFTDFALQHGARKVIAVEKGTGQMSPVLFSNPRLELHEKTDIFGFEVPEGVEIIVIDVSFVSIVPVLEYLWKSLGRDERGLRDGRDDIRDGRGGVRGVRGGVAVLAMLKPQFEVAPRELVGGVVKNSAMRRRIIKEFEARVKPRFAIVAKRDNALVGAKGNEERFYYLRPVFVER